VLPDYLIHTQPDIYYAVGYLSRFMEMPSVEHWNAVKHLLRYIPGTRTLGCYYTRQEPNAKLVGFSDADWAGDVDDRKSTSGVMFFFGSSPVSWQSTKQKIVALSTFEAEYVAAIAAACLGSGSADCTLNWFKYGHPPTVSAGICLFHEGWTERFLIHRLGICPSKVV
jgi:hypothetical protein